MFDNIHQQNLADGIKRLVESTKPSKPTRDTTDQRRRALAAVQLFERCGWQPRALEQALADTAAPLSFDGIRATYTGNEPMGAWGAVEALMTRYAELVPCEDIEREPVS